MTEDLESRIRETPLVERLQKAQELIGQMCKEGRPPKMTIPARAYDEDLFIVTTLQDAVKELQRNRGHD